MLVVVDWLGRRSKGVEKQANEREALAGLVRRVKQLRVEVVIDEMTNRFALLFGIIMRSADGLIHDSSWVDVMNRDSPT